MCCVLNSCRSSNKRVGRIPKSCSINGCVCVYVSKKTSNRFIDDGNLLLVFPNAAECKYIEQHWTRAKNQQAQAHRYEMERETTKKPKKKSGENKITKATSKFPLTTHFISSLNIRNGRKMKKFYILLTSCRFLLHRRDARSWWPSLGIACASCKLCETEHKQESLDRSLIVMAASILTNNHFVVLFACAVYRRVESHGSDTQHTQIYQVRESWYTSWCSMRHFLFKLPKWVMVDGWWYARFYAKIIILNDSCTDFVDQINMNCRQEWKPPHPHLFKRWAWCVEQKQSAQ